MTAQAQEVTGWRSTLPAAVRPYTEAAPLAVAVPRHLLRISPTR